MPEPIPSTYLVQIAEAVRELLTDFGEDPVTFLRLGADALGLAVIPETQCALCFAESKAHLSISYPPNGKPIALCAVHAGLRVFEVGYAEVLVNLFGELPEH